MAKDLYPREIINALLGIGPSLGTLLEGFMRVRLGREVVWSNWQDKYLLKWENEKCWDDRLGSQNHHCEEGDSCQNHRPGEGDSSHLNHHPGKGDFNHSLWMGGMVLSRIPETNLFTRKKLDCWWVREEKRTGRKGHKEGWEHGDCVNFDGLSRYDVIEVPIAVADLGDYEDRLLGGTCDVSVPQSPSSLGTFTDGAVSGLRRAEGHGFGGRRKAGPVVS